MGLLGICREFCICICPPRRFGPGSPRLGISTSIRRSIRHVGEDQQRSRLPRMPGAADRILRSSANCSWAGSARSFSPTSPGVQMRIASSIPRTRQPWPAAINAAQLTITVPRGAVLPPSIRHLGLRSTARAVETMTVTAVAANTWTVTRGQDGTTAAAAAAGAEVWIDPETDHRPAGSDHAPRVSVARIISWAEKLRGFPPTAGPTSAATPSSPGSRLSIDGTDPGSLQICVVGTPWVGPQNTTSLRTSPTGWIEVDTGKHQRRLPDAPQLRLRPRSCGGAPLRLWRHVQGLISTRMQRRQGDP